MTAVLVHVDVIVVMLVKNKERLRLCFGVDILCDVLHRCVNHAREGSDRLECALNVLSAIDAVVTEHGKPVMS